MMAIVGLQVAPLTAILDKIGGAVTNGLGDTASGIDKNSSADPALYLDRISTIFRYRLQYNFFTLSAIRSFPRFRKLFSDSSTIVMQLPCCPGKEEELSEKC